MEVYNQSDNERCHYHACVGLVPVKLVGNYTGILELVVNGNMEITNLRP